MPRRRGSASEPRDDDVLQIIAVEPERAGGFARRPAEDSGRGAGPETRGRRGPVLVAVVVVVALVASAVASQRHRSQGRAASSTTLDALHTNLHLNDAPNGERPLFPFLVGTQVLTGTAAGLRLVDTDTGVVTAPEIRGLPLGPVTIVAHSGGTVAVQNGADLFWLSMREAVAHSLDGPTAATTAFAAVEPGHLWMAGAGFATEVPDGTGVVATKGAAIGATTDGLLVETAAGIVVQPVKPGVGRARLLISAPGQVIGVHRDRVAWIENECGVLRCPVHITEVKTGATTSWLQIGGHPRPIAFLGASAVFSPDGGNLAIAVPNDSVTRVATMVVADLRSRTTRVLDADSKFELPARPGSGDATGETIDWTPDGNFLVFAPSLTSGSKRVGVVDALTPTIVSSRVDVDVGLSAAAVAVSSAGPAHRPRRVAGPVAPGAPSALNLDGLSLAGVDDQQVDVADLGSNRVRTWAVDGLIPNPAGPYALARVTGGWLVVRGGVVDLMRDAGSTVNPTLVDSGSLVFSADHGRRAWIALSNGTAWPYDPVTGTSGPTIPALSSIGVPVGAVDDGLVVARQTDASTVEIEAVDNSGRVRKGPAVRTNGLRVVATGGDRVAYTDRFGLNLFDFATGTRRLVAPGAVQQAALSPDGRNLAWVGPYPGGGPENRVLAMRVGTKTVHQLDDAGERLMVADGGTVLFTNGANVRRGRVDADGSTPVYGLAPAPQALLALG